MTTETTERRVPRYEDEAAVDWLELRIPVAPNYGDPEQYRDDVERLMLLAVALLGAGGRRHEIERRMRGYEPRDAFEAAA
jgi:hypothetical protein